MAERQYSKQEIAQMVIDEAKRQGVDPKFAYAIAMHESGFDNNKPGGLDEIGLFQIRPGTAKQYGLGDIKSLEGNIRGGVAILKDLNTVYGGDKTKMAGAYNAGKGAVKDDLMALPESTRNTYLPGVNSIYKGLANVGGSQTAPTGTLPDQLSEPAGGSTDTIAAPSAQASPDLGAQFGGPAVVGGAAASAVTNASGILPTGATVKAQNQFATQTANDQFRTAQKGYDQEVKSRGAQAKAAYGGELEAWKRQNPNVNIKEYIGTRSRGEMPSIPAYVEKSPIVDSSGKPFQTRVEPQFVNELTPARPLPTGTSTRQVSPPPDFKPADISDLKQPVREMPNLKNTTSKIGSLIGDGLRALGTVGSVAGTGLNSYDAYQHYKKGETGKAIISGLGAVGATMTLAPGVGQIVGIPLSMLPTFMELLDNAAKNTSKEQVADPTLGNTLGASP